MQTIKCEMCGSTNLIKQDGVYVCQHCGTKYSVEEAKKLMIEGTLDVTGSTIKVDQSQDLSNLYILARRARDEEDSDNAKKYYEELLLKDPNNWECAYYSAYYKAVGCKVGETGLAASTLKNTTSTCLNMIKEQLNGEEQKNAYKDIANRNAVLGILLYKSCEKLKNIQTYSVTLDMSGLDMQYTALKMIDSTGDMIFDIFGDKECALELFKIAYTPISDELEMFKELDSTKFKIALKEKIQKLDPDFDAKAVAKAKQQSGGCYVATAVYGSYDCPQVWTLRRYRDYDLAASWYGRAFVHIYYAISPTLVKWFGNTYWFRKMWRGKLDRMVKKLQDKGYESTPYQDRNW